MRTPTRGDAAVTFACCTLGSMAVGYILHGPSLFITDLVSFQFVAGGVMSAALATVGTTRGSKGLLVLSLGAYPLLLLFTGADSGSLYLRDLIWVIGLALAVKLGLANDRLFPRLVIGRFVLWSAVFGSIHGTMYATLCLMGGHPIAAEPALAAARLGAAIGAGVGLGYELSQLYHRWQHTIRARRSDA